MGGLLNHAKKFLRGMTPALPTRAQTFAVRCPEGHRITGVRTEGYQALRCPTCGEGVFVLPRSPLPEPAAAPVGSTSQRSRTTRMYPTPEVVGGTMDEGPVALTDPIPYSDSGVDHPEPDVATEDEIVWDNEETTDAPRDATPTPKPPRGDPADFAAAEMAETPLEAGPGTLRKAGTGASYAPIAPGTAAPNRRTDNESSVPAQARPERVKARAVAASEHAAIARKPGRSAASVEVVEPVETGPPWNPVGWAIRHRNLLLFLTVPLLVAGTIAYRVRQADLAQMPIVAEKALKDGLPALDEGKFDTARQLLFDGRRAVDRLGDQSEGASAVRQGASEIEVITQLASASLEDMLDEAARSDPEEWSKQFARIYRGRMVILDATVEAVPDGQGRGRYELDYRILRPGEGDQPRTLGRVDTTGLILFEQTRPRVGDHVLFGARLASFRYDLDREQWSVGLVPDSGVTLVHHKALEALGLVRDADAPGEGESP